MVEVELNGFDEGGSVGGNLCFVRVGIKEENHLRPLIYNILHMGRPLMSKINIKTQTSRSLIDYAKTILRDPAIDVTYYDFSLESQLSVLSRFKLLEDKNLFGKRYELMDAIRNKNEEGLWKIAQYMKRYNKSPLWMEMFLKSYAFRLIVGDIKNYSKTLKESNSTRCPCYVDGGYPFVCWWNELNDDSSKKFSSKTPIYGVTKGDEYYPIINMAGNVASIANKNPGIIFPHNIKNVVMIGNDEFNSFYNHFSKNVDRPKFYNRVLFVGKLHEDMRYMIPFLKHIKDNHNIFEPIKIKSTLGLDKLFKAFGRKRDDIFVLGKTDTSEDEKLKKECEACGCTIIEESDFLDDFIDINKRIQEEADRSNLSKNHISKIKSRTDRSIETVKTHLK